MTTAIAPQTTYALMEAPEIKALAAGRAQADALVKLEPYAPQMAAMLPPAYPFRRLIAGYLYAVQKNPKILDCTAASTATALVRVAQTGLTIGETIHLVPSAGVLDAWSDYKGDIERIKRSGHVRDIYARVVREGDHFVVRQGTHESIEHQPRAGSLAAVTHAYAVVKLRGGEVTFEVMDADEIESIRQGSRGKDQEPWVKRWAEMAKKTVIKRIAKRLPKAVLDAAGFRADEDEPPGHVFGRATLAGTQDDDPYLPGQPSARQLAAAERVEGAVQQAALRAAPAVDHETPDEPVVTSDGEPVTDDEGEPTCPACHGPMWDNRANKRNPNAPDYKCRNAPKTRGGPGCEGVIWPERGH